MRPSPVTAASTEPSGAAASDRTRPRRPRAMRRGSPVPSRERISRASSPRRSVTYATWPVVPIGRGSRARTAGSFGQRPRGTGAVRERVHGAVPLDHREVAALVRVGADEAVSGLDLERPHGSGEPYVDELRLGREGRLQVQAAARVVDDPRAVGGGVAHVALVGAVVRVLREVAALGVHRPQLRLLVGVVGEGRAEVAGEDQAVPHPCGRVDAGGLVGQRPGPGALRGAEPQLRGGAAAVALPHREVAPVRGGHGDRAVVLERARHGRAVRRGASPARRGRPSGATSVRGRAGRPPTRRARGRRRASRPRTCAARPTT